MVDDAAWGAHHNLRAAAQRFELWAVWGAAVDGQDREVVEVACVGGERFRYLEREFAGWCEHEDLRGFGWPVDVVDFGDLGERGDRERRGLTGSGLCESHDVAAFKQGRDGRGLDR